MNIDTLKALTVVKKNLTDAKKQLLSYNVSLQKKYGDELELKSITTVSQGQWAENLAHNYLCQQGLKPIERNFRCKTGEIDLIFLDKTILAFIEVRYRKNSRIYGGSLESIDVRKQQRIIKTATYYLHTHKWAQQFSCRFDAVLISGNTINPELSWISDAFRI